MLVNIFSRFEKIHEQLSIKNFNEEALGQLFSYFILETALIGMIANIDPFNQPSVEQVKIITNRILK